MAQRNADGPITIEQYRQIVVGDLRHAMALLRRKATPEEVEAYQQLVLHVCARVAGAYREGNLIGASGVAAAPAEQAAIDDVQAALAPPRWFAQVVDRIRDLFGGAP